MARRTAAALFAELFEMVEWNVGTIDGGPRELLAGAPLRVRWLPAPSRRTFVADPFVVVLSEASHDSEEILVVECDPRRIEEVRRNWPFLRDRRINAYSGILSRVLD